MASPRSLSLIFVIGSSLCLTHGLAWAEAGILVVHVKDVQRRPVTGVQIGVEGDGGSSITGNDGKARVPLAKDTKEKSWASLQILQSPSGMDFVMVSPWDYRTVVPSFENESENFVEVVIVQRGDRAALESGSVLVAFTQKINKANAPKPADKKSPPLDPKANLAVVAKQYGLSPEDVDQAIRNWGAKTTDPYEAGLAALYLRDYAKASEQLSESLQKKEERLAADQKAVADNAAFLGVSLYSAGRYREAAVAFRRCLQLRPLDVTTMDSLAWSLTEEDDYAAAEPLFREALFLQEVLSGPESPAVADTLDGLAQVLEDKADYQAAEPLYRRALAIKEKVFGPDHQAVASILDDLGVLLSDKGDWTGAEPLFRRALAIDEKQLGSDSLAVASVLIDLESLLEDKGDLVAAEPLARRGLAIREKALGMEHPDVATGLNNLAEILREKRDYAAAEPLYKQALAIDEKMLGPENRELSVDLSNLAVLYQAEGNLADAEPLIRRALAIREKVLGPDHPDTAESLTDLASLLRAKHDPANAELFYRRALAIYEKRSDASNRDAIEIRAILETMNHPRPKPER